MNFTLLSQFKRYLDNQLENDIEERHIPFDNYDDISIEDYIYAVATDGDMKYFFEVNSYQIMDEGTSKFDFTFYKSETNERDRDFTLLSQFKNYLDHELMTDEEDRHITFGNYDSVSLEDDLYAVATDGNMNYFFGVDSIPYKFTDAGTSCFDFTFCKSEINEPGMAAARIKGNKSKVIKEIER